MNRKNFITGAIAIASTLVVPVIYWRHSLDERDPVFTPDMLGRFCDEDTIREIGKKYLNLSPHEAMKDKLRQLILSDDSGHQLMSSAPSAVADWVDRRVQDDFKGEKTILIDGWILSQTEARQCALFSIVKK